MVLVQKSPFFQLLFFGQYRPGKCVLRYYTTKKLLSRVQKREVQRVKKIDIFAKGLTHGFNQIWPFFKLYFFRKYRARKCLLRYSRTKKRLSRV